MAIGLTQYGGANIPGFSGPVAPDRRFTRNRTPKVRVASFGDGYEQRKPIGINNFTEVYNLTFVNRPQTEMDDLQTFFSSLNGVDLLTYRLKDTNSSPQEQEISVVCDSWSVSNPNENVQSLTCTLRRVYEP